MLCVHLTRNVTLTQLDSELSHTSPTVTSMHARSNAAQQQPRGAPSGQGRGREADAQR